MKSKTTPPQQIQTASQVRKHRISHAITIALRVILILTTILVTWIIDWGCALGWIDRARAGSNWPIDFVGYGQMLLVASGFLTIGAVLTLLTRKGWLNWTAIGCAVIGVTLCLLALCHVASYAEEHSFYSRIMNTQASTLYYVQLLPNIIPGLCIVLLNIIRIFSYESCQKRRMRKTKSEEKSPSIL